MLPDTPGDDAVVLAERLRKVVAGSPTNWQQNEITVTLTLGVAEHGGSGNVDQTIREADIALYSGKEKGRNCVASH